MAIAPIPRERSVNEYIGVRTQAPHAPDRGRGDVWQDQAACLGVDPRLFDPIDRHDHDTPSRFRDARSVCSGCDVKADCITDAKQTFASGIRAGLYFHSGQQTHDPGQRVAS